MLRISSISTGQLETPARFPTFVLNAGMDNGSPTFGGFHCKQTSCHTCILQKIGQIGVCPWHPVANEPSKELVLRACHFCCRRDPATSVVTVTGYMKLHSNCFTFSIFHITTEESSSLFGDEVCRLRTPIDIFSSTLSENFISPKELARIAAPFRDDGLPDDLYRHFFLQVGGPIQSIEQWLQFRSPE